MSPCLRRTSMGRIMAIGAATAVTAMAVSLTAAGAASASSNQTYYVPVSKAWVVDGHGYGHGHGMSQYGAEGAALSGVKYRSIMHFYYPGTSWARAKGNIRVLISADWTSDLEVRPAKQLTVRDLADGAHWRLRSGKAVDAWRLTPASDGSTALQYLKAGRWHRWHVPDGRKTFRSDAQFHAPRGLTLVTPGGSTERFRGILRLARPSPGATTRDTVNVLSMDDYVQGVVPYEMPASWRQQALRAQAVAARTYAAWERAQNPHRYYQICDTTSCQVYGGMAAEQTSSNQAVQATAGQILTYHGSPAFTQFASSSGGWTAYGGQPYLPAKHDPYDDFSANPMHSWSMNVSASSLERTYPQIGRLKKLTVTERDGHGAWHGRVEQISLVGTGGRASMSGDDFRAEYGLRSDWFTIEATPIIRRWRSLGGPKSRLGEPTSGEYAVMRGSEQNFAHGRIFWDAKTGAYEITKGPILTLYRDANGPDSKLGWPDSGLMRAPAKGHKVRFQRGKIYSSRAAGTHMVFGAILTRWRQSGGAVSWFGYPTSDVRVISGGQRGRFEHGVITWDRATNTYTIQHL
jgi:stage II sporulation protein D